MNAIIPGRMLTASALQAAINDAVDAAVAGLTPSTGGGAQQLLVPRRYLGTQRSTGYTSWWSTSTIPDTQTFHEIRTIPAASGWFRFGFFRDKAVGTCSVAGMIIAQTASEASPINPIDEAGAAAAWTQVTFNAGGAPIDLDEQLRADLAGTSSPLTGVALNNPPANAALWGDPDIADWRKQHATTWTRWVHSRPYRRIDAGVHSLLMARVKFTGDVRAAFALGASYDADSNGRYVKSYVNAGDCVTTPGLFTSTTRSTLGIGLMVQYIPHRPIVQVGTTGDSNYAPVLSHVAIACLRLSSASVPIEFCSTARGGLSASEYADTYIEIGRQVVPSIMFIETWSPNAGTSLSASELGWAKNMQIAEQVQRAGGVPVLMTPIPNSVTITTVAQEAIRLMIRDRCLQARDAGAKVLDLDGLLSTGGSIASIKPEYTADLIHLTQEGQELVAEQATIPMMQSLLNL